MWVQGDGRERGHGAQGRAGPAQGHLPQRRLRHWVSGGYSLHVFKKALRFFFGFARVLRLNSFGFGVYRVEGCLLQGCLPQRRQRNGVCNPEPYTLRPTPCALYPKPYTLHPPLYTLHPIP